MVYPNNQDLLTKLKSLADRNFPKFQNQLPAEEQVYVLKTNEGLSVVIRLSRNGISVQEGEFANPISTLTMASSDLDQMLSGQLDAVKAFLAGKIKIQGDVFKTMALNNILKGG
ncbi:MAG: SCP2 sterol-binding domain-containing protein [Conexivisphaerales archaeon]